MSEAMRTLRELERKYWYVTAEQLGYDFATVVMGDVRKSMAGQQMSDDDYRRLIELAAGEP